MPDLLMIRRLAVCFLIALMWPLAGYTQPSWQWAKSALSPSNERYNDIATDPLTGTSFTAGFFIGDLSQEYPIGVNGTPDMSGPFGARDGFVARHDASGNAIWAFKIGGAGASTEVNGICIGPSGNLYITGWFNGTVNFQGVTTSGSSTLTAAVGGNDMFVASYTADGNLIWAVQGTGSAGDDAGNAIASNATGVYVTGFYGTDITFAPLPSPTLLQLGGDEAFTIKYDFLGNAQWAARVTGTLGGNPYEHGLNIAADATDVYVLGVSNSDDFTFQAPGPVINIPNSGPGFREIWAVSYAEGTGFANWAQRMGGTLGDEANGIAVDAAGVYITGGVDDNGGMVEFPGPVFIATGNQAEEIFTCKLFKATGLTDWVQLEINNNFTDSHGRDIVADGAGNLYIAGHMSGTTNFNGGANPLGTAGGSDVFVMSRTNTGAFNWVLGVGSTGTDWGMGISTDNFTGVYVAGYYQNAMTLGTINLADDAGDNGFIGRLAFCDASFNYSPAKFCALFDPDPTPTITGDPLGTFSEATGNVTFVSTATGQIDLSASTIGGPYEIVYTAPNLCTDTFLVEIEENCWQWANGHSSANDECGNDIAIDSLNGFVYVAGFIENNAAFPTLPAGNLNDGAGVNGSRDGFLAKYDFSGALIWVVNMGGNLNDEVTGVTVGPTGNVYLTGYFTTGMRFFSTSALPGSLASGPNLQDMFVACYNPAGNYQWSTNGGGPANDAGLAISSDNNGLYVAGHYNGSATFGAFNTNPSYGGAINNFLVAYDFAGTELWLGEMKSNGNDYNTFNTVQDQRMDIACHLDSVYVIGMTGGTNFRVFENGVDVGISYSTGNENLYVVSFDALGNYNWANYIDHTSFAYGFGISVDCDGVYIAGSLHDGAIFPGGTTLATGDHDNPFIAQLQHGTGDEVWVKTWPSSITHDDVIKDIVADGYGGLFIIGNFGSNPFILPDDNITGAIGIEMVVARYTTAGVFDWVEPVMGTGNENGMALALYRNTNLFATGCYSLNTSFSPINLFSGTNDNLFVSGMPLIPKGPLSDCCPVPPVGGTAAVSPAAYCSSGNVTLTLSGHTGNIQWQVSYDGGATWTDISGATSASEVHTPVSSPVQYRAILSVNMCPDDISSVAAAALETTAPTITCPANSATSADASCQFTLLDYTGSAVIGDNCGAAGVTVTQSPVPGTVVGLGATLITLTATDGAGNTSSCAFTLTVNDNTGPTISCPGNVVQGNDPGVCTAVVNGIAPAGITDNCTAAPSVTWSTTGATVLSGPNDASGQAFNVGVTTVTYTADDGNGNTTSCSFTITINDATPPVITCPAPVTQSNDAGNCSAVVTGIAPTGFSDNCNPAPTVTYTLTGATGGSGANDASGQTFNVGVTTVTYTVDDGNGNTNTCAFDVTITDTEAPALSCPASIVQGNDLNVCGATINGIGPVTTDNCGTTNIVWSMSGATNGGGAGDASGTFFNVGVTNLQYDVNDGNGNTSSCIFSITINDTESPVIACPADLTVNVDPGTCSALVNNIGLVTNVDNCIAITSVNWALFGATSGTGFNDASGTTFNLGVTTVQYTVDDGTTAPSVCSFTVTVVDNEAPVITCPANVVQPSFPGVCAAIVTNIAPVSVVDNCTGSPSVSWSLSGATSGSGITDASGTAFSLGLTTVTYTADDGNGNLDSCSFTVFITDTAPPVVNCPNDTVLCDSVVNYTMPTATDDCSPFTIAQTDGTGLVPGSTFPVGITTLEFTVTDTAGNSTICTFDVTILPPITPGFDASMPDTLCLFDPDLDLTAYVTLNAGETGSFTGTNGAIFVAGTQFSPSLSDSGTYVITHTVTNGICSDSATATIVVLSQFNAAWTPPDTICESGGIFSLDPFLDPGSDTLGVWYGHPSITANLFDPSGLGGTTITIGYASGLFPCQDSVEHSFYVSPDIDPTWAFAADTICASFGTFDLNTLVTGTAGGTWTGPGINNTIFDPDTLSGTISITYRVGEGSCAETEAHLLTIYQDPVANAGIDDEICGMEYGLEATLTTGSGFWTSNSGGVAFDSPGSDTTLVTVSSEGTYSFVWTETRWQCQSFDTVDITFWQPPMADAGPDQDLDFTYTTTINATSPAPGTGIWTTASGNGTVLDPTFELSDVEALSIGMNTFTWTVTNGICPPAVDVVNVIVADIFVPNGFSPNADGVNDEFVIRGVDEFPNELLIFNRWGVLLWEAEDYQNEWDGRDQNGKVLPDDTYFYILKLTDQNREFSGYITLKKAY